MYITSVEISNFRSFQGYHNFDFKFQDARNLNVIFGKNGVGKSIFVDAIYWCLYGKEILDYPSQPLYNHSAFNELDVDNELPVIVACKFEDNEEIFEVKRELFFIKKSNNDSTLFNPNGILSIILHNNDGNVEVRRVPFFTRIPEFLFSFLFYDDENSDFFAEDYNISLKNIIVNFGLFDVVDATNSHINSLLNHYIKEIKKFGPDENEFAMLLNQEDKILKNLKKTKNEIVDISKQKQKLIDNQNKINMEISSFSNEADELLQRRSRLSDELNMLENRIYHVEINKQKLLFKSFPGVVFFSKCNESNELDNVLNSPHMENSNFSKSYYQIKQSYNSLYTFDSIKHAYKELNNLKMDLNSIYDELNEINAFFNANDESNIGSLTARNNDIEKSIRSLDNELAFLKMKYDSLDESLRYNDARMKKLGESQFSQDIIHRRIDFCKDAEDFGQQLQKEWAKSILSKIEDCCNRIFFHHFGMDNKFRKIVLNDSFDIQIIKHSNQILSPNDLSSSEKSLLRLSLIFSIYRSFGLKFPIILMDPFSKLDIDKVGGLFYFIFEEVDNQVIFILNDNPYNDYIKHNFLNDNVVFYQLIENYDNVEVISYEN